MSRPHPAESFGTAALRDGLGSAWRSSPTRLREDAATEAALVRAGYRDRVLTELAQNAADAASRAAVAGTLRVWCEGTELHVANTGEPLDEAGVQALTALRASSKAGGVGRFGVGFTAVLSVADEGEIRSRTGSVRFSAADTRSLRA
ncbi:sacsin N-terminal ATP-binding-like domain-containing protein, partial [Rhodococcus chondri]|nr:ATP-binding protein [Rhodococcus sp. CC-R104]